MCVAGNIGVVGQIVGDGPRIGEHIVDMAVVDDDGPGAVGNAASGVQDAAGIDQQLSGDRGASRIAIRAGEGHQGIAGDGDRT